MGMLLNVIGLLLILGIIALSFMVVKRGGEPYDDGTWIGILTKFCMGAAGGLVCAMFFIMILHRLLDWLEQMRLIS